MSLYAPIQPAKENLCESNKKPKNFNGQLNTSLREEHVETIVTYLENLI